MNDEQKTPEDDQPTADQATVEQPAPPPAAPEVPDNEAKPKVFNSPRTRNILLTSGAGLALAGGVLGFGIGHATAGDDGRRDDRVSRFAPGDGRPDFGDRGDRGDRRGGRPGPGAESGNQPNGDNGPT